jgi:hypothetical protein
MRRIKPDNVYEPRYKRILLKILVCITLAVVSFTCLGKYHHSNYYTKPGTIKTYWEKGLGEDASRGFPERETIRFHLPKKAVYARLMVNVNGHVKEVTSGELGSQRQDADMNTYFFRCAKKHKFNGTCWMIFEDRTGQAIGVSNKAKFFYAGGNWSK